MRFGGWRSSVLQNVQLDFHQVLQQTADDDDYDDKLIFLHVKLEWNSHEIIEWIQFSLFIKRVITYDPSLSNCFVSSELYLDCVGNVRSESAMISRATQSRNYLTI